MLGAFWGGGERKKWQVLFYIPILNSRWSDESSPIPI